MKCLVTGGTGFIGSHLVDALVEKGYQVRVIDNFFSSKKENLSHLNGKVEILQGDIRDTGMVNQVMQGIDYVMHEAALKLVPESFENPQDYNDVNIQGTLNLLRAAHANKVKKFVYASSSSAYGDSPKLPKEETDLPNEVRDPSLRSG